MSLRRGEAGAHGVHGQVRRAQGAPRFRAATPFVLVQPRDADPRIDAELPGIPAAGRDRKQFGIDPWISIAGLDKAEWRRRAEAWRALGATHLAVDTMRAGFATPKAHMDAIKSFREVLG